MPSLLGTYVTTNYNRVVGPTYDVTGDVRTYTGPYSNFGTRLLKFYSVKADHGGAVNFTKGTLAATGSYTDSGSLLTMAILALQQFGEVFYVGKPGTGGFIVALADDTANSADVGSHDQLDNSTPPVATFGAMEAAIKAALKLDPNDTVTVTQIVEQANGLSIA